MPVSEALCQYERRSFRLCGTAPQAAEAAGVKKVFIRSGIRFDYLLADKDETFFDELIKYHISGQLKVAPEHICDAVLKRMGKPENAVFQQFLKKYKQKNEQFHMNQYVVPYLMSSHPGSTLKGSSCACRIYPGSRLYAAAGTGFLSDAFHDVDGHVLYRDRSARYVTCLCGA